MAADAKQDVQTQSAQAADEIMRRIAILELDPGSTFTERELATALGMGKVPVREALLRLAATGLLTPRTGSGYTVSPITLLAARNAFDAWRVVEPAAIDLALQHGRAKLIVTGLRAAAKEKASLPSSLLELQFHLGLVVGSGNSYLAQGFPHVEVARLLALANRLGHEARCGDAAHAKLLKALEKKDASASELALRNIEALQHQVIEALTTAATLQAINLVEG